jgi:CheY-like chemotaxis protein
MKILIIEDDLGAAVVLEKFLTPVSSQITVAKTMNDALKVVSSADEINLITMDLGLPDSDVEHTLGKIKEIRKTRPDSLIVVVTGQEINELEKQVLEEGADGYITKQSDSFTSKGFLNLLSTIVQKYTSSPKHPMQSISMLESVASKLSKIQSIENATTA